MSTEIFHYQPMMLDTKGGTVFNVVHSEFENMATQRGLISERQKQYFSFSYNDKLLLPGESETLRDEIQAFYNARQGSFDNFFLPSWRLEAKLQEAVTTSDNTFILHKNPTYMGFSKTALQPGNWVYFCHRFPRDFEVSPTHEVRQIIDWSESGGEWTVTVDSTFDNDYSVGTYVQKAYIVYFASPDLAYIKDIPYSVGYTIDFVEDLSELYLSDFGG